MQDQDEKEIVVSILLTESASNCIFQDDECSSKDNVIQTKSYTNFKKHLHKILDDLMFSEDPIESDTALFTTSNISSVSNFDDLSTEFLENQANGRQIEHIASLPDVLIPTRILTHSPIVLANGDSDEDICRICHRGDSCEEDLLNPCRCKGSIALAHLNCLERWLMESNRDDCELCRYRYTIIREPMYTIPWSVIMFLRHPDQHAREILLDLIIFIVYTPSVFTSSYLLASLCESVPEMTNRNSLLSYFLTLTAILGISAIDFSYMSWLIMSIQKYTAIWRRWYKKKCRLKIILSSNKLIHTRRS